MIWKVSLSDVSMVMLGMSSCLCGGLSLMMLNNGSCEVVEWEFFNLCSMSMTFSLIFDWFSMSFLCFVYLISSSVLFYSKSYMEGEKNMNRFMYLVVCFVISMSFMVLSPNMVSILLGWDGLGLVSYALVIFYQNEKSVNAGLLTILSNRVGDVAVLLSIALMSSMGDWSFFIWSSYIGEELLMLKLMVVMASMTKSAQIPFSAWLPAAMAAPTPVSALVHSSTLVTAGVYLMIRFSPALEGSKSQSMLLLLSCLTMFMAGLGANFEYDLKKIIALSTLSQLGVMLSVLSLGYPELSFFHLLSHALFKALLFMCAGVVIHNVGGCQDIRYMGGLVKFMPLTMSFMSVANMALCGFPFLAGFYSKDLIIETFFLSPLNNISFILYVLATGLTVMYTFRLIFYSLSGGYNLFPLSNVKDWDKIMSNSMVGLGIGGVMGGSILSWLMISEAQMICMSSVMKNLVVMISVLGGLTGYMLNNLSVNSMLNSMKNYKMTVMSGSMWFLPLLSSLKMSEVSLMSGGSLSKSADMGWMEYFGGQGVLYTSSKFFETLRKLELNTLSVLMKMFMMIFIMNLVMSN
uniref:NADH dehydrogenase subunit 5 n=1 Tax=Domecia hispida TaxID=652862 RepID=UPI0028D26B50|nr:NADH dehydrogenase subunit 5 [Domecia hispida]WMQ53162.1 NADH dehydrogenase subunit 5 [Domecia hispida]